MSENCLIEKYRSLNSYRRLKEYYEEPSDMEMFRIARWENQHSSFLCWLFNKSETHKLHTTALTKFLEILRKNEHAGFPEDLIQTKEIEIEDTRVEVVVDGGRIDLWVEFSTIVKASPRQFRLVVENKVDAKEGEDQTARYVAALADAPDGKKPIFVFLTPPGADGPDRPEFFHMNYQQIVEGMLDPLLGESGLNDLVRVRIKQYLRALSAPRHFAIEGRPARILGVCKKEHSLLHQFVNDEGIREILAEAARNEDDEFWTKEGRFLLVVQKSLQLASPEEDPWQGQVDRNKLNKKLNEVARRSKEPSIALIDMLSGLRTVCRTQNKLLIPMEDNELTSINGNHVKWPAVVCCKKIRLFWYLHQNGAIQIDLKIGSAVSRYKDGQKSRAHKSYWSSDKYLADATFRSLLGIVGDKEFPLCHFKVNSSGEFQETDSKVGRVVGDILLFSIEEDGSRNKETNVSEGSSDKALQHAIIQFCTKTREPSFPSGLFEVRAENNNQPHEYSVKFIPYRKDPDCIFRSVNAFQSMMTQAINDACNTVDENVAARRN